MTDPKLLSKVYGMAELATMIGWDRQRLVRHLKHMNRELKGLLLVNIGTKDRPRWTITLDALKKISPQWFRDDETFEVRLEALEEARLRDEARLAQQATRIADLSGQVKHLSTVTDLLSSNLRAVTGGAAT